MLTCRTCGGSVGLDRVHKCPGLISKSEPKPDPMRAALVAIQAEHEPKHGELPVYAPDDYHAEREPIRWHKYTICANCLTAYPCPTRRLADDALTARTTKNGDA